MDMPSSSAELWPADGVPEHWINELFKRMGRTWGNSFLEKWPQEDLRGVKIEWARALRKLSTAELKAGVDALMTLKFPPSLPEFFALCKQMRLQDMPSTPYLTDQTRASEKVVAANMGRLREIMQPLMQPKEPTAEWAYKLLMLGTQKNGKPLTFEGIKCATDAISSKAGLKVIEECLDEKLRGEYRTVRDEIVASYRASGKKLWETA